MSTWIPVSESLPGEYQTVLVAARGYNEPLRALYFTGGTPKWTRWQVSDDGIDDAESPVEYKDLHVAHWMPLPPMPEKG